MMMMTMMEREKKEDDGGEGDEDEDEDDDDDDDDDGDLRTSSSHSEQILDPCKQNVGILLVLCDKADIAAVVAKALTGAANQDPVAIASCGNRVSPSLNPIVIRS